MWSHFRGLYKNTQIFRFHTALCVGWWSSTSVLPTEWVHSGQVSLFGRRLGLSTSRTKRKDHQLGVTTCSCGLGMMLGGIFNHPGCFIWNLTQEGQSRLVAGYQQLHVYITHVYRHTHIHAYKYVYMYLHIHIYIYMCIYTWGFHEEPTKGSVFGAALDSMAHHSCPIEMQLQRSQRSPSLCWTAFGRWTSSTSEDWPCTSRSVKECSMKALICNNNRNDNSNNNNNNSKSNNKNNNNNNNSDNNINQCAERGAIRQAKVGIRQSLELA